MSFKRIAVALALVGMVCTLPSFGQATKPRSWYGYGQGGWAGPQADADSIVDDGWNLGGGAVYWPTDWPVGLQFDLSYNPFDLKSNITAALDADNGEVDVWTIGANIQWAVPTNHTVGFYLMGGVSVDYIDARLTDDVGVIVCDPFYWWWCYPGVGQATTAEQTDWKFGYQAGLGISFKLEGGTLLYLEGRYHWIDESGASFAFLPVVFGVRF